MKSMILALLIATISFNSYAQVKTEKDMKQEIKKMEELIQERLGMVKTYPEKPAYYLQVNKTWPACSASRWSHPAGTGSCC